MTSPAATFAVSVGAAIEVTGVSKSFERRGERLSVLDRISLEAASGEFISVIGPSGCGKSTMFNILAGLESPDAGQVKVNGAVATGELKHFAYMPQKDLLFAWRRVIDNATLGLEIQGMRKKEARARVEPLLETFGLTGFDRSYPFELSGGMRQRVALLRTIVQGRQVVLLDEPFGALDYLTRTDLQLWLSSMWEQFHWTVVLITHDVPEALLLSDRVYVLGNGRPACAASWMWTCRGHAAWNASARPGSPSWRRFCCRTSAARAGSEGTGRAGRGWVGRGSRRVGRDTGLSSGHGRAGAARRRRRPGRCRRAGHPRPDRVGRGGRPRPAVLRTARPIPSPAAPSFPASSTRTSTCASATGPISPRPPKTPRRWRRPSRCIAVAC